MDYLQSEEYWVGRSPRWKHAPFLPEMITFLSILRFKSVLDFGCGHGEASEALFDDKKYLGVDFSESQVEIAQKNYPDKTFKVVDSRIWKPKRVDLVFAHTVLEHIPSPEFELITEKLLSCCKIAMFVETDVEKVQWTMDHGFDRDYKHCFGLWTWKIDIDHKKHSIFIVVRDTDLETQRSLSECLVTTAKIILPNSVNDN